MSNKGRCLALSTFTTEYEKLPDNLSRVKTVAATKKTMEIATQKCYKK